ncbi:MAG: (4Fe-4S)-binding protein, partial [Proteobacteria bacterium]|nr:(4Fe-4S)-binding protein [Pseudomonadota bacterium]
MRFKKMMLYVMSGTGNTYRLARWMKDMAGDRGVDGEVMMIDDVAFDEQPENSPDRAIGVLFPAHGFMAPWSMMKFLFRLPRGKGAPAICAATRGGIKAGPVVIPGAVGMGTFMAALIMLIKGYRVGAVFSLDMPANFINLHWGMTPKNTEFVSSRAKRKLAPLMNRILEGRRILFTRNNLWEL